MVWHLGFLFLAQGTGFIYFIQVLHLNQEIRDVNDHININISVIFNKLKDQDSSVINFKNCCHIVGCPLDFNLHL